MEDRLKLDYSQLRPEYRPPNPGSNEPSVVMFVLKPRATPNTDPNAAAKMRRLDILAPDET